MVMILVVTGVGALIHIFSVGYMQDDPGYPRYFAYLNLFVFFMLVLRAWRELPRAVRRLGRSRPLLLPVDRVLVQRTRRMQMRVRRHLSSTASETLVFLVAMFMLFANIGVLDFIVGERQGD